MRFPRPFNSPAMLSAITTIAFFAVLSEVAFAQDTFLPQFWSGADIGATGTAGSAAFSGPQLRFTVTAPASSVIGGTSDSLHFIGTPLNGDGQLIAHVEGIYSPLSRSAWTATAFGSRSGWPPSSAIDGNTSSEWQVYDSNSTGDGYLKYAGEWFQVDMGSSQTFGAISMDQGTDTSTCPGDFNVLVSNNGVSWTTAGQGFTHFYTGRTFITFPVQTARYVRIQLTDSGYGGWWSIAEFNVYGTTIPAAAQAGVMIRQNNSAGAPYAATLLTPAQGAQFLFRTTAGGGAGGGPVAGITAPYWVKIVRWGVNLQSWISVDGSNWTAVNGVNINLPYTTQIGFAVSSGSSTQPVMAVIDSLQISPESASPADSFVDSIGTNVHMMDYSSYTTINNALVNSGIRHIRDGGSAVAEWQSLAQNGVHLDLLCSSGTGSNGGTSGGLVAPSTFASMAQTLGASVLDSVEYTNEPDSGSFPSNWISVNDSYCQQVHNLLKGNSATAGIKLISTSVTNYVDVVTNAQAFNMASIADYGNVHPYNYEIEPWTAGLPGNNGTIGDGSNIDAVLNHYSVLTPGIPTMVTEEGYFTGTAQYCRSPIVQGKYVSRIFLENFLRGVPRTYQYDFMDDGSDPTNQEDNFGMVDVNGISKPACTTIKNMIALLGDPGTPGLTGGLNYTLSGSNMATVHHLLLQKKNGDYYLVLWQEIASTDTPSFQSVTLTFNQPVIQVQTYDPTTSTTATATYTLPSQISVSVPDYPLIVRISTSAKVTYAGAQLNLGDGVRSTSVTKSLDAGTDNAYGTDGLMYFNTSPLSYPGGGAYAFPCFGPGTVTQLPFYVSSMGVSTAAEGIYAGYANPYPRTNDPTQPIAAVVSDVYSGFAGLQGVSPNAEYPLFNIVLGATPPPSFRIGVFQNNLQPNAPAALRIAGVNGSASTSVASSSGSDFYFFDITGASPGELLTVYGTTASGQSSEFLGGITFDSAY